MTVVDDEWPSDEETPWALRGSLWNLSSNVER